MATQINIETLHLSPHNNQECLSKFLAVPQNILDKHTTKKINSLQNALVGQKQCERFDKLRLYGSYKNGDSGQRLQLLHSDKSEEVIIDNC